MSYTGYQDALTNGAAEQPTLARLLALLDEHETSNGIKYTAAPAKKAREAAERASALREALRARQAAAQQAALIPGREYATGSATADDVVNAALEAAPLLVADTHKAAARLVEGAAVAVERDGLAALLGMSEEEWLKPIRPVIRERVQSANAEADAVGIHEPHRQMVGVRSNRHAWAPDVHELKHDMGLRHAWERLGAALDALAAVYDLPDRLRQFGLLPAVPGRATLEDYRWRRVDRLNGQPHLVREFWLANRHSEEPGIFTAAEMSETADVTA